MIFLAKALMEQFIVELNVQRMKNGFLLSSLLIATIFYSEQTHQQNNRQDCV